MAEAIIRQHRRRTDRWMQKGCVITAAQVRAAGDFVLRCVPGYLLAFAEIVGIPSGLHVSLAVALAASGMDLRPVLGGGAAAVMMRLLSGLEPHWETLMPLGMILLGARMLKGQGTLVISMAAAVAMLPTGLLGLLTPTAAQMLQHWAAVVLSALFAPLFARAISVLHDGRQISGMEALVAVCTLLGMCILGGARMMLGINLGMWLSGCAVLAAALTLGVSAGSMTGMLCGVLLALQGIPLTAAVALSMGGFLAGISAALTRRIACGAFGMGAYLPLLLCSVTGLGCGASVLAAALTIGLLPRPHMEHLQQFIRRFLPSHAAPGDAYAASSLMRWEKTITAMAQAVPSPKDETEAHGAAWWQDRLCQGCEEYDSCGCMTTDMAADRAEKIWQYRHADDEIWQGALENLRGLGCRRLYHLLEGMDALRSEASEQQRVLRQAEARRSMLVTHLRAMSGAAKRFAVLSSGECWWDDMAARRIRRELDERAIPAMLSWVRRVQGHVQAAFEWRCSAGADVKAEELCLLTSLVVDVPMQVTGTDGERVHLSEQPPLRAETGKAAAAVTGGTCCGDTIWCGELADGRYLATLCDGMGHGAPAQLASQQAAELLRLCLDAGYSRHQALTAVNGMLLLDGGELFSTADVLTIDLWRGRATLDKLGAASSWLSQQGVLSRFTGDALPLGILEEIDLSGSDMRLHDGDAVVLLSDGVEEAFPNTAALEEAILRAVQEESPQDAAEALLYAAYNAGGACRQDDQSAVVVYIRRNQQALQAHRRGV